MSFLECLNVGLQTGKKWKSAQSVRLCDPVALTSEAKGSSVHFGG